MISRIGNQHSNSSAPNSDQTESQNSRDRSEAAHDRLPSLSLPKGGGAIKGIGEKFGANPVTGTGNMSVPIITSSGRSGFGPQLNLSYDSSSGNGVFGLGWHLSLTAITRKTDKGLPQYRDAEDSDVFILSETEDLVPVLVETSAGWEKEVLPTRNVAGEDYQIRRYRPRVEGAFSRIERWTSVQSGETHWRTITRDNVTTLYGKDDNSRIFAPAKGGQEKRVFSWLICQSYDDKGNAMVFDYVAEDDQNVDQSSLNERNRIHDSNRYLRSIKYGNRVSRLIQPDLDQAQWLFEVVFDYDEGRYQDLPLVAGVAEAEQHRFVRCALAPAEPWSSRPDPFSVHRSGFEVRTNRRCHRILMFHRFTELGPEPYLVGATEFDYKDLDYSQSPSIEQQLAHQGSTRIASFIASVTHSGFVRDETAPIVTVNNVNFVTYLKKSLPSLDFEYSKASIQDEIQPVDEESLENLPAGLDGSNYQWVDLDGEGLSGILTEQAGALFYKPNLGNGTFGPMSLVPTQPSVANLSGGQQQLIDLAGDGQLDLVAFATTTPGFYERTNAEDWESFKSFSKLPNIRWDDPNLRFVDLSGDGHADVLVTEDDVITWYPSLAEEGFAAAVTITKTLDEERGPRLVLADGTQSIYLADMCGDGLTDLVRIRNGEICYWPNLGYGRFGARVSMDNAPWFDNPDQFSQQRVRIADLDGSGTTDIIYLGRDRARLYFNESGNRWSEPRDLKQFPAVDNLASVTTADLLGKGTACLLWSTPSHANGRQSLLFIDLMQTKPHLLTGWSNNLGAETRLEYVPSTKFYLADKQAGNPWITKIPFPVHVVERVETLDQISGNRFISRYAYHHGYFDGVEREFRGFGMVEQWDTEEFAALNAGQQLPTGTNIDESSHVPPVLTRTWFHTGTYLTRDHVSDYFAGLLNNADTGEYFREPGLNDAQARELLLADTVLPSGLSVDEEREACRALKGAVLRKEVFALDGSAKENFPYVVGEHNFTIKQLQPMRSNRHAIYLTHGRESLDYNYERIPNDPRISHSLTLEVDRFGNTLQSAAVTYGRRQPDSTLPDADQDKQTEIHVSFTQSRVTNPIESDDSFRSPLVFETSTYELTGMTLQPGQQRFTIDNFISAIPTAAEIQYEEPTTAGELQKRLVEKVRTLFRKDNLTGALQLGDLESLALPFETYHLAFTPGLLTKVYGNRVTDAMLETEARYVHSDGDFNWWTPSGKTFFSLDSNDSPAQELQFAREHFFLEHRSRNPFHTNLISTESTVTYDAYNLLMVESRDAVGNVVTAATRDDQGNTAVRIDYRTLQPFWITDANGNRTRVAFDALGMVAGVAVMGKPLEGKGDSLDGFEPNLTESVILDHLANPFANPEAILSQATNRTVYDLFSFQRSKAQPQPQPNVVYGMSRETHVSDPLPVNGLRIQHRYSYSDGMGREIQKKFQAEPGPVPTRDADGKIIVGADGLPVMTANDVSPRWVGTGWTIINNKGSAVRKYESFFSDTHRCDFDVRIGVSSILFYDPVGRVVATLHPNHTFRKEVFNGWQTASWDENDTVLIADPSLDADVGNYFQRLPATDYMPSWHTLRANGALGPQEQAAATKTSIHAATPTVSYADSLGRTFLKIVHNRFKYSDTPAQSPPVEEFYRSTVVLDIEANEREIVDAEGRVVMRYDYNMLSGRIHHASMETGEEWSLNDVAGKSLYQWNSRGHRFRSTYDALQRPVDSLLDDGSGTELVVGRVQYGESESNPEDRNLRGQMIRVFDQSGVVISDDYDFKGNHLSIRRQFAQEYKVTLNWSNPAPLQPEIFTNETTYDAFNRPLEITSPDASIIRPTYNEAGLLERMDVNLRGSAELTPFVTDVDYDARGNRLTVDYGNDVRTTYTYDPLTSRLVHLLTARNAQDFPDDCPQPPPAGWPGCQVQNLHYTFDAVGNITHIRDDAQQTIFFRNKRVEPTAEFTHDAIYRLIEATGREHLGQSGAAPTPSSYNDDPRIGILLSSSDGNAMGRYLERYLFDAVGNLQQMAHEGSDPVNAGWTRSFTYNETSQLESARKCNRLTSSTIGADTETYSSNGNGYDVHGNMLRMPQLQIMQWDFKDHLQMTQRQAVNASDDDGVQHQGERTWYVYDSAGVRVRKVTEAASGQIKEERLYLGGFERFHKHGANSLVRESLHVVDGDRRIAIVETKTEESGAEVSEPSLIRYQFDNHLGSASLELDHLAQTISYEEYSPYGSTTYQAVRSQTEAPKRYRYTEMERDEETGLNHHGARYYAPWLGRWTAPDPGGLIDGSNVYSYVNGRVLSLVDHSGLAGKPKSAGKAAKPTGKGSPQMSLVEYVTKKNPAKAIATKEGRGFSTALRDWAKKQNDLWAGPERMDIVHQNKPFVLTKAGETQDVGIGERTANRKQSASERQMGKDARSKGQYARVNSTDPTAKSGVNYKQPDPPVIDAITPKPIEVTPPAAPPAPAAPATPATPTPAPAPAAATPAVEPAPVAAPKPAVVSTLSTKPIEAVKPGGPKIEGASFFKGPEGKVGGALFVAGLVVTALDLYEAKNSEERAQIGVNFVGGMAAFHVVSKVPVVGPFVVGVTAAGGIGYAVGEKTAKYVIPDKVNVAIGQGIMEGAVGFKKEDISLLDNVDITEAAVTGVGEAIVKDVFKAKPEDYEALENLEIPLIGWKPFHM